MRAWRWEQQLGFGVIAGPVSGHTESWDFENLETFDAFCEAGRAIGLGDLLDRLLDGYCDATPRDGRRILVRYPVDVEWQAEAARDECHRRARAPSRRHRRVRR
jgi:hypothetical protein